MDKPTTRMTVKEEVASLPELVAGLQFVGTDLAVSDLLVGIEYVDGRDYQARDIVIRQFNRAITMELLNVNKLQLDYVIDVLSAVAEEMTDNDAIQKIWDILIQPLMDLEDRIAIDRKFIKKLIETTRGENATLASCILDILNKLNNPNIDSLPAALVALDRSSYIQSPIHRQVLISISDVLEVAILNLISECGADNDEQRKSKLMKILSRYKTFLTQNVTEG